MKLLKLAVGLLILLSSGACAVMEPEFSGPKTWLVSQMERVELGEWETLDTRVITEISAARAEFEAFQLVIRAPRSGLTNVNVTVSPFQNEAGEALPAPELFREHYVYVRRASKRGTPLNKNVPEGAGWYADALVPFDAAGTLDIPSHPFSVEPRKNQPVWVDVFVPEGASPGVYTSRYTVESSEGTASGTLSLRVWDITLPSTPSLMSSFELWEETTPAARDLLLRHKVMPKFTPQDEQAEAIRSKGLSSVNLSFWSDADLENCQMPPPYSVSLMKERKETFNPNLLIFNYSADEIDGCPQIFDQVKAWSRSLDEIGVKQLITMFPVNELFDNGRGKTAVDIWVFSPGHYVDRNNAQAMLDKALEVSDVWSYTALMPNDDTPKWGIDYLPMNHRIMQGFINQRYNLTGLLYWRVDAWLNNPWNNVTPSNETWPAGEGMLIYPGRQIGENAPAPSMRLKWIREGAEDYEYVQLANNLGQGPQAQNIIQTAAKDWRNWTKDAATVEQVRKDLVALIQRYQ